MMFAAEHAFATSYKAWSSYETSRCLLSYDGVFLTRFIYLHCACNFIFLQVRLYPHTTTHSRADTSQHVNQAVNMSSLTPLAALKPFNTSNHSVYSSSPSLSAQSPHGRSRTQYLNTIPPTNHTTVPPAGNAIAPQSLTLLEIIPNAVKRYDRCINVYVGFFVHAHEASAMILTNHQFRGVAQLPECVPVSKNIVSAPSLVLISSLS